MMKYNNQKEEPIIRDEDLRKRVESGVKDIRLSAPELKLPRPKTLPVIPVTGSNVQAGLLKHYQNKD